MLINGMIIIFNLTLITQRFHIIWVLLDVVSVTQHFIDQKHEWPMHMFSITSHQWMCLSF